MCSGNYKYVLIGENRMIMCQEGDFSEKKIKKIIGKAFPELIKSLKDKIIGIRYQVEGCQKHFSSQFDVQVGPLERRHNWKENPYMALKVFKEGSRTYCSARAVIL